MLPIVFPVTSHTDHVGQGSTFVVIKGALRDGLDFICEAINKGALHIVIQEDSVLSFDVADIIKTKNIKVTKVKDARLALAQLSAEANGHPANSLSLIGVTGTKGKTTTTFVVEHVLRYAGYKTALISTVGNGINGKQIPSELTTPNPDYLHVFLKECVAQGVSHVVMEVSAQAMSLHRVHGLKFTSIAFTNFSQEHAEFYPVFKDYFEAKKSLFEQRNSDETVFINADDQWGRKILLERPTYQSISIRDIENVRDARDGISFVLDDLPITCSSLFGTYNIYNILMALRIVQAQGIPPSKIIQALEQPFSIPGRMDRFRLSNGAQCIIDYAHNPSSFKAVLSVLRPLFRKVIVVFGAGGDRDAKKRPNMGKIASEFADKIIITTDNPRSEDPAMIARDIMSGILYDYKHKVLCELDREEALRRAYKLSDSDTVIALLGKGPDEYQLVQGQKLPFSEKSIIQSL